MSEIYKRSKYCRWCGNHYRAARPGDRDGFCSTTCKQAHYRAYKKYVTATSGTRTRSASKQVTQK